MPRKYFIDHSRAITTILIVVCHTSYICAFSESGFVAHFLLSLLTGGTFIFVMIAGYVYKNIDSDRYLYLDYIKNKIKKVFLPYLILTTPGVFFAIYSKSVYPIVVFHDFYFLPVQLSAPLLLYFTGRSVTGHWFVPFIMLVFLCTPLFKKVLQLNQLMQSILLSILMLISTLVWRPIGNVNIFQAFVYFFPFFIFGMLFLNDKVMKTNSLYIFFFLVVFFALSFFDYYLTGTHSNREKYFFDLQYPDLMVISKFTFCIFLFVFVFKYFNEKKIPLLSLISSYSYTIFLLHPYVVFVIKRLLPLAGSGYPIFDLFLYSTINLFVVILFAKFGKMVLGENSKYIIGC